MPNLNPPERRRPLFLEIELIRRRVELVKLCAGAAAFESSRDGWEAGSYLGAGAAETGRIRLRRGVGPSGSVSVSLSWCTTSLNELEYGKDDAEWGCAAGRYGEPLTGEGRWNPREKAFGGVIGRL